MLTEMILPVIKGLIYPCIYLFLAVGHATLGFSSLTPPRWLLSTRSPDFFCLLWINFTIWVKLSESLYRVLLGGCLLISLAALVVMRCLRVTSAMSP